MGVFSHVISTTHLPSSRFHGISLFPSSSSNSRYPTFMPSSLPYKARIFSELKSQNSSSSTCSIDFTDPDWKLKFQADFEERFRLPHITDVFHDEVPIPSTFCLKMRLASCFNVSSVFEENLIGTHCGICVVFFFGYELVVVYGTELRFLEIFLEIILQMRSGMGTSTTTTGCCSRYVFFIFPLILSNFGSE